jgi:hypothetical protein
MSSSIPALSQPHTISRHYAVLSAVIYDDYEKIIFGFYCITTTWSCVLFSSKFQCPVPCHKRAGREKNGRE